MALQTGPVATRLPSSEFAAYGPGIWFGGAFSPARLGSRVALVPQLELAFVHRRAGAGGAADRSLALDFLDLSMIVRGELPVGGRIVYGLGGVFGSALLRAQRTDAGAVTDARDAVRALDAGWIAGAGVELASRTSAKLSLELRYQRGIRDLFPARPEDVTQQSLAGLVSISFGSVPPPPPSRAHPDEGRPPCAGNAALAAIEARMSRLITALERTSPAAPGARRGASSCDARAARPAVAGLLAMPAECPTADARHTTLEALHTVLLALARDLAALVARLQALTRDEHAPRRWPVIASLLVDPTVSQVEWMVDMLTEARSLLAGQGVPAGRDQAWVWQQVGRNYERALLGAQVLALWLSWLDFAKQLATYPLYSLEIILERLFDTWGEMEPVLEQLRSGAPASLRDAARTLQDRLPAWSEVLSAWGRDAARDIRQGQQVLQALAIVQAAFDLATMRAVIGLRSGPTAGFAFVLPGIGGITAAGAATGVRVVISAEWLRAMQHLIAIGAISTVEIARIAGVSSLASVPVPRPVPPPAWPDGRGTVGVPTAPQSRPVRILVKHRGGNRQVEVNGQRWNLPKGKRGKDIPASDPVGDRLQAEVDKIARKWNPGQLAPREQKAIDKAHAAGKRWLARLLEREARGRWVEGQAKRFFERKMPQLKWNHRGVDIVDRETGIMYEVLSGTAKNMRHHARRMAKEMFRMITF